MKLSPTKALVPGLAFGHLAMADPGPFQVVPNPGGFNMFNAAFGGTGLWETDIVYQGAGSGGTFTNGPEFMGEGIILTTGSASGAGQGGDANVDTGRQGSSFCSPGFDETLFKVFFDVPGDVRTITVNYVFATAERE